MSLNQHLCIFTLNALFCLGSFICWRLASVRLEERLRLLKEMNDSLKPPPKRIEITHIHKRD